MSKLLIFENVIDTILPDVGAIAKPDNSRQLVLAKLVTVSGIPLDIALMFEFIVIIKGKYTLTTEMIRKVVGVVKFNV